MDEGEIHSNEFWNTAIDIVQSSHTHIMVRFFSFILLVAPSLLVPGDNLLHCIAPTIALLHHASLLGTIMGNRRKGC